MINQKEMSAAIQWFAREDGTVDIWDHPNFKSSIVLPDNYRPITRVEEGLELMKQGKLNEDAMTVLKVIGDAICANEDQLRRYLSKKISFSQTSEHLLFLRKFGFVERHKCRLAFIEEEGQEVIRPPGPHTLGIAGYKLLNHYYGEESFTTPDYWQQNPKGVQRYVALNELRCLAVESGNIRGWSWHPFVGGNTKYNQPSAVMKVDADGGELQFIIDRAQMSQNFIGYFKMRLEEFRFLYERDNMIVVDGFKRTSRQIITLSVSSLDMANFIHKQLNLHSYPFDIWFIIDEWFSEEEGLGAACAHVTKEKVSRIRVKMLNKAPK